MSDESETKKLRWHALFTEEDTTRSEEGNPAYKLSIGRVMNWILLGALLWMWVSGTAVPESLLIAFITVLGYNMGKKFTPLTKKALSTADSMKTKGKTQ